jgi:DNA mismatch endonuclease (patch repair protein)
LPKIEGNRQRDRRVRAQLRKAGWRVLTIWECEIRQIERMSLKLRKFLQCP